MKKRVKNDKLISVDISLHKESSTYKYVKYFGTSEHGSMLIYRTREKEDGTRVDPKEYPDFLDVTVHFKKKGKDE